MTTAPLVTVLMSVHNGGPYVDEAIGSILRQTFTDFEFLIVDDASTDDTPARIAAFGDPRIRVIRNDVNLGLTRSLNRGLAAALGSLVARQDADDVSHPGRLAAQVAFLEREPDVVVLGTQCRYIDSRGAPKKVAPWPKSTSNLAIRWQLLFDGPFIHTSVIFRKAVVWGELGGYDESFVTSQDFELWSRISARGHAMRNLPQALVDFRVHSASASTSYELERVVRVAPVVRQNVMAELGVGAIPEGWADAWIRLNNPRVFPDSAGEWKLVSRAIKAIHHAFTRKYPESADDPEIRTHRASMLIRLSQWGAERRQFASLASFAHACRLDPAMAAHAAPRYFGRWTIGRWRPARRPVPVQPPRD